MTFPKLVGRGLEHLALFLALLGAGGMVAIVGLIFTSVILRKFFNAPLFFTEEVVGILMSVSLFLTLPMVTLRSSHIRVTILTSFLQTRSDIAYVAVVALASIIGIVFCGWLVLEAVPWFEFGLRLKLKTETSRIPLYPAMAVLPISVILMGVIFFARLIGWIPNDDAAKPDNGRPGRSPSDAGRKP